MKIITNKKTIKRIIMLLVVVIIFNTIMPIYHVSADEDTDFAGKLFRPLFLFATTVADLVESGLQWIFMGDGQINVERS